MKRKLITFAIILACFFLECTLFDHLSFALIKPNLMIIVTSSFGFMRGKKSGMFVGFICGLLSDLFWGDSLGLYMLIYTVIGYANGAFQRLFYDDDIKLPIGLIGASELVYGLCSYICLHMLHGDFDFPGYLFEIILPELVYTILITLLLYQAILQINKKLEAEEQRSASKFV
ncbi:rod shape-determining protein MreD [uncultured Merdimonas sp.]|uniref:rod shape-determining protein MreD n=1 Tax=uncultured Merdimonas sp. TaxID=2023269 RepID=UPI00320A9123